MHTAIVNGLSRKNAATWLFVHLLSFLGDVKSFDDTASPESAIFMSDIALSRSTIMYKMLVKIGHVAYDGRREKKGSSRGAWWKTPPSYGETLWL